MEIYELLRPGRADSKESMLQVSKKLREEKQAILLAEFIEEAASFYEMRGLFRKRY